MGGGGSADNTIRYAPYLEAAHSQLLNHKGADTPALSVIDVFNATINQSPYGDYVPLYINDAFFGHGYEMKNFPSLFDLFGKFLAGVDICDLFGQIYENIVHGAEIEAAIRAQAEELDADIQTSVMPRFLAGMRDINSVIASSFVIGKAVIEDARVRSINKFASEIRLKAVDATIKVWERHLDWNKNVATVYADLFKLYYDKSMEVDARNLEYASKDKLWNLNLFDDVRAVLGAMGGAASAGGKNEPSQVSKSVGGALSGAAAGSMIAPGIGTVVGGVLGLAASFF